MSSLTSSLIALLQQAKRGAKILNTIDQEKRNAAIKSMAESVQSHAKEILQANALDMHNATHLPQTMQKRLELDAKKLTLMAQSLCDIAALEFRTHSLIREWINHAGLHIAQVHVPLGVIGVIYESRPNVTSDVSALCLKSANACVLKGGKEAHHSNLAIFKALTAALSVHNIPKECISMIDHSSREITKAFVKMDNYVDLLIPRGGEGLIEWVKQNATIPIIKHDKGVCHTYIHKSADLDKALEIVLNAKLSYPAACNSLECVLLDSELFGAGVDSRLKCQISESSFGVRLIESLHKSGVCVMFENDTMLKAFGNECDGLADFTREWGEARLNFKLVNGIDEALEHIATYGSGHSEAIVSEDRFMNERFLNEVDASCVYVNASTRFSDGGEFGFGAEVGISTSKLHARGPMGLESLQSYKYRIYGNGQVRS